MDDEGLERRLTTILSADVVGYSRMMGEDEAGTLAALKALRKDLFEPKTSQYHGRTVKLMGDGVLMEFPSVVDAVQFAVETQYAVQQRNLDHPDDRKLQFRIGLLKIRLIQQLNSYSKGARLLRMEINSGVRDCVSIGISSGRQIALCNSAEK